MSGVKLTKVQLMSRLHKLVVVQVYEHFYDIETGEVKLDQTASLGAELFNSIRKVKHVAARTHCLRECLHKFLLNLKYDRLNEDEIVLAKKIVIGDDIHSDTFCSGWAESAVRAVVDRKDWTAGHVAQHFISLIGPTIQMFHDGAANSIFEDQIREHSDLLTDYE